jgi:hypothetical protein
MNELIDYTTIARLLTDLGVPTDRGRYLIRLLATPDHRLRQSVRVWAMDAAISANRLSDEQLASFRSALGNSSECP